MKLLSYIFLLLLSLSPSAKAKISFQYKPDKFQIKSDSVKPTFSEIKFDSLGFQNRMAYADTANFMHAKIYPCARCFLRPEAAQALEKAAVIAKSKGYTLVIYDCYRPYPFQQKMYDIVNNPKYVAPPGKGSNHNRGAAVDVSLADENGQLLDMGGDFDDFSQISHYAAKSITVKARKNRRLLRHIMEKSGFTAYNNEWWHFDYKKQRYDTSSFIWECNE